MASGIFKIFVYKDRISMICKTGWEVVVSFPMI